MTPATLTCLWQQPGSARNYRAAVSLHSHTNHSKENMGFVPRYARCLPGMRWAALLQEKFAYRRVSGQPLDFERAYWTPPLAPVEAHALECRQITRLGLRPLVSLTDHDDVEACLHLQAINTAPAVPISTEWTVPFGGTFLHVGVHNMPDTLGGRFMDELGRYTANPSNALLLKLLDALHASTETLVVLNHPLWDEEEIGFGPHKRAVLSFLQLCGPRIHGLELNGLRSNSENNRVGKLAQDTGRLLVSGGDRHGLEPNAVLNLTHASTFAEFTHEIRAERRSHILVMPQYREPYRMRVIQGLLDVVREDEVNCPGRSRWTDRVFYRCDDGEVRSLAALWREGEPFLVQQFIRAVRLLEGAWLRPALRAALFDRESGVTW